MQLSALAHPDTGRWNLAVDGRWLGGDGAADPAPAAPVDSADGADAAASGPGTVTFPDVDLGATGSARLVAIWLESGERFGLSALRPAQAKGHDHDAVAVTLPPTRAPDRVFDPRLSTEYGPDGAPRRFGIELWLGADEEAEQHVLRLAGEAEAAPAAALELAVAGSAAWPAGLEVRPMSAHGAGSHGVALYLRLTR